MADVKECPHGHGDMVAPVHGDPLEPDSPYCPECGHIHGNGCDDGCHHAGDGEYPEHMFTTGEIAAEETLLRFKAARDRRKNMILWAVGAFVGFLNATLHWLLRPKMLEIYAKPTFAWTGFPPTDLWRVQFWVFVLIGVWGVGAFIYHYRRDPPMPGDMAYDALVKLTRDAKREEDE